MLAHDLDRDLLDRQRQRRLGLRRAHAHALGAEALHQPLGDDLAEALEGAVAALGRRERDDVARLGVVDRVLEPVGQHGVAVGDVERDVELEPLADLLLGVGDAVVGVDREAAELDLDARVRPVVVRLHAPNFIAARCGPLAARRGSPRRRSPRRAPAATSWTRSIVGAVGASASTQDAIVPPRRSSTSRPVILPMKLLREVPTHERPPELAELAEPAQQLEVVLDGLAEADPGVEPDPLLGDPGRERELDPLGEERPDVVDDVVVARVLLHRPRVALHVHQHDLAAALGAQRRQLGVARSAVTSLTIAAPASSAASATAAFEVSIETRGAVAAGEALDHRHDPPQLLVGAETSAAPGRVDSPPTSSMSAPSRDELAPVRDRALRRRGTGRRRRTSPGSR